LSTISGGFTVQIPSWFSPVFGQLLAGEDLDMGQALEVFREVISGRVDEAQIAALITALRIKGEAPAEIAAATLALRERMLRLVPIRGPVVDTCGTGGDESGTFNISTASALVVAATGMPVVKHGNRAVSSRSGSADVLRELGVPIESGVAWAQRCLDRLGFAFCYAPHFHGGMAHVATLRKKLGIRTIFNLLGPLANPAQAEFQLIGVGNAELLDPLAEALALLEPRRAVLVCGFDGLDEVTLAAPTMVRIVEGRSYRTEEWSPWDFGLGTVSLNEIHAADPAASAAIIRSALTGQHDAAQRIILANAAAALWATGSVLSLREGVERAEAALSQGLAWNLLQKLVAREPETGQDSP
jgi:anthranilate phosphoribosyltransferase